MSGQITVTTQRHAWKQGCLGLTAALLLLGCGKREIIASGTVPTWLNRPAWVMELAFRRPILDTTTIAGKPLERGVPAIDPRHGRVFVGTSDKALHAVRATDGSELWKFRTGGAVHSEPLYDDDRDVVYFGSEDDGLYAVRARDGALIWRYRTGAEVHRKPVLVNRPGGTSILVFVNAADGVFAVDPDTGKTRWKHVRAPALGFEIAGHAGATVDDSRVFAAFSTGKVVAYDVDTGVERWPEVDLSASAGTTAGAGEDARQVFDVDTTPVVVADRVYVASIANGIFALDATVGAQQWRRPEAEGVAWLTHWIEPSHFDEVTKVETPERSLLIAGSGTTGLWALDPRSGEVRWRKKTPRGSVSFPIQISGALMVTTSRLGLFLLDPKTGGVIDGVDTGTDFFGGAAVHGNRAFVLSNGGVLFGLEVIPPNRGPTTVKSW